MNNPQQPESKTWVRLAVIGGVTCAVITWVLNLPSLLWWTNGYYGRLYDRTTFPAVVAATLITLIVGISLQKRRPTTGRVLIWLAIASIIFWLLTPEL
jgi:hypothetical protein